MKKLHVFTIGAAYGLLMRLCFGLVNPSTMSGATGPMLSSFVLLVPFLIGVYTVFAVRKESPGLRFAVVGPWAPTFAFVAGTALLLIEGSICIAMALPLFLLMASLGGIVSLVVVRNSQPKAGSMHALLLLPLLTGYAESQVALPQVLSQSVASTHIAARPETVWNYINHAVAIKPEEMRGGLAYMIGVPYPLEAITHVTPAGRVRKLRWDKNVSFDEPITAWQENRFVQWTYRFKPDSFPAGALDEHILIGGKYFDLVDTAYRLEPEAGGTRLDIVVNYRVSTNFNWYAAWWGRVLVDDSAAAILRFYKQRSEA
ncbi:MAG: SRPBCC family protein [Pseudomonadota bacterium]